MKIIKCKNRYKNEAGDTVECGRILGVLTDMQVDMLHLDAEKGPIFRCPKCHTEQRWIQVEGNQETRKITFRVLDENPEFKGDEVKYDDLIICEQVG